jgi:hypothetical protein
MCNFNLANAFEDKSEKEVPATKAAISRVKPFAIFLP